MAEADTETKPNEGGGDTAAAKDKDKETTITTTQSEDPEGSDEPSSSDPPKAETEPANPAAEEKPDSPTSAKEEKEKSKNGGGEEKSKKEEAVTPTKPDAPGSNLPIVSSTKRSRPPYKYDPAKITLRFLFANRDGLTVTVECTPADTVGEVKGALLSVWPEDLPNCTGGDQLRLVCMGKGILMPDTRTLEDCQVPVFKTHPTPINVSIRPAISAVETSKNSNDAKRAAGGPVGGSGANGGSADQGCACIIL